MKEDVQERKYDNMKRCGIKRDTVDERDLIYEDRMLVMSPDIPLSFSLENEAPKARDQGRFNACSAFSGVYAKAMIDGNKDIEYSPAFLYYFSRVYEDGYADKSNDYGVTLRNMCKALKHKGVCLEKLMPYDDNLLEKNPSNDALQNSKFHKIQNYVRIKNGLLSLKQYIYSTRKPVILGVDLYESYMDDKVSRTGIFPIPDIKKEKCVGGHGLICLGWVSCNGIKNRIKHFINKKYSSEGYIICLSSWGSDYGNNGLIYIPFEYFNNTEDGQSLVYDFWTIE